MNTFAYIRQNTANSNINERRVWQPFNTANVFMSIFELSFFYMGFLVE